MYGYQQHIWTVCGKRRDSSLPLVDIHHLLCQSSQEVSLVHFQGADIQHRQVSWQLLQQGTTSSIPELWEGQTRSRTAGFSPPSQKRPSSLQKRFPQFSHRTLSLLSTPCLIGLQQTCSTMPPLPPTLTPLMSSHAACCPSSPFGLLFHTKGNPSPPLPHRS